MTPFFKDAIDLNVNEFERVGWFVLLYALPFTSGLTRLRSRCASVCAFSAKAFTPYRSRPVNGRIKSAMTGLSMYQSDKTMRLPLNLVNMSCLGMVPENAGGGGQNVSCSDSGPWRKRGRLYIAWFLYNRHRSIYPRLQRLHRARALGRRFITFTLVLFMAVALTMLADSVPYVQNGPGLFTSQVIEAQQTCTMHDGTPGPLHGRTPVVVSRIMQHFPNYRDALFNPQCERVTAGDLLGIESLGLAAANISSLRTGDFDGMLNLKTLNLDQNQLTSLPQGIFRDNTKLQTLTMHENRFASIARHKFNGLSDLQTLRLDQNQLTSLHSHIFRDLSGLRTLRLDQNQLSSLHRNAFGELFSLIELRLDQNQLTTLDENIFNHLPYLETLRLDRNPNLFIPDPPSFFHNQHFLHLQALYLGLGVPNDAEMRPYTIRMPTLTTLRLDVEDAATNCGTSPLQGRTKKVVDKIVEQVPGFPACADVTSTHLASDITFLDYESAGITMLRAGDFAGLSSLTFLQLHKNELTSLPGNTFAGMSSLEQLRLDDNDLASLDRDTFAGLPRLDQLHLHENKLTSLPNDVFNGLSRLLQLRLDDNPDLIVPEPSFFANQSLDRLETLYLGSGVPNAQETQPYQAVISTLTTLRLNVMDAATSCGTSPLQGRTQNVVERIVLAISGVNDCADVTATHLSTTTRTIFLSRRGITMLRAGDFAGMPNVRGVRLENNQLTSLPSNVFNGLSSVTQIRLDGNQLTSLPSNVFNGLSSLQTLRLDGNQLTSLPSNVFNGLSSLRVLLLDGNPDLIVPEASFFDNQSLTSLLTLRMGSGVPNDEEIAPYRAAIGNTLTLLRLDVEDAATTCGTSPLQGRTKKVVDKIVQRISGVNDCADATSTHLENLTFLLLSRSQISALRAGDFAGMSGLRILSLSDNDLTSLPEDIFDGLSNLRTLSLTNNDLNSLHRDTFEGLSNLGENNALVSLEGNELTYIDGGTFRDQQNLTTLFLRKNKLASLHGDAFDGLSGLKTLYLDENELSSLHEDTFEELSSMTRLHLQHNQLSSLHKDLFNGLTNLRELDLNSNNISLLTENLLLGLSSLEIFRVDENPDLVLPEPPYFFRQGLDSLAQLYIGSGVPSDEEVAPYRQVLPMLVTLRLDIPSVAECLADPNNPDSAGPMHHRSKELVDLLIDLYFPGRPCSEITAGELASLTTLRLGQENLHGLRVGDFAGMTGVTRLYLDENELRDLPAGVFNGLPNLELLYLNHNHLSHLHRDSFKGLSNLRHLHLYSNRLTDIHRTSFHGLSNLHELFMENNQLTSLHKDTFKGLRSLQTLRLYSNLLTSLDKDTFAGLSNLEQLYLYGLQDTSRLTFLPEGIFNGLSKLQTLLLYGNPELVNLEPQFFTGQGLNSLVTLRMGSIHASASEWSRYRAAGLPRLMNLRLHVEPVASCGSSPVDDWTQKIVDAVLEVTPDVTECEDIEAEHLAAITSLDLTGRGILTLTADDFSGMSGLTTLNLNGNLLAYLPRDAFDGLSNLRTLNLNHNRLTYLPEGIFDGLRGLVTLNLNDNRLDTLPSNAFAGMSGFAARNSHGNQSASMPLASVTLKDEVVTEVEVFNGRSGLATPNLGSNLLVSMSVSATSRDGSVAGIFDGSSGLTVQDVNVSQLASLPAPAISGDVSVKGLAALDIGTDQTVRGIFKRMSSFTALSLDDDGVTVQPAAPATRGDETVQIVDDPTGLTTLNLNNNMLTSLPANAFNGLSDLRELHIRNNQLTELPANLFRGLRSLIILRVDGNPRLVNPQPSYFRGQGLTRLTTLYFGTASASAQQLASYRTGLPALRYLRLNARTSRVREFYVRIQRIEPDVEAVVLNAGDKIRLKLKVFGRQGIQDDSLADEVSDERVAFQWSSSDDSVDDGFTESTSYESRRNQTADDRTVLYTAPDVPGEYTVTAELDQGQCVGSEEECSATIKVIVNRNIAILPTPTPIPCQISGTIPSVLTDSRGNQYSVFTPAQGGNFNNGDRTAEITAPINTVRGCEYIGIRMDGNGMAADMNVSMHRYTLAGQIYSVTAVDSSGTGISDYEFDIPARVCVPLPPSLRGGITDISLIKLNRQDVAGSLNVLSSKIVIMSNGDPRVCGLLPQLPAEVAAGNRGAPPTPETLMLSPTPEAPITGAATIPYSWVLLIAVLGAGVIMLGSAVLIRGRTAPA